MTLDPGNGGTGVAIWDLELFNEQKTMDEIIYYEPEFIKSYRMISPEAYGRQIKALFELFPIKEMYIENPSYMGGSVKGQATATTGSLVKLCKLCGIYEATAFYNDVVCHYIDVNTWKGQLPKDVVKNRILEVWPECHATNHDWDAVGIGYYIMGLINR